MTSMNVTDQPSKMLAPSRGLRRLTLRATLALIASTSLFAAADQALACGGCFVSQSTPTVVSGHRMALSISTIQSVLWDQIQYSGDPAEFAWVLPVKSGARIEASTSAFFEVLEATTRLNVTAPPVNCGSSGGGLGCGAQARSAGAEDSSGEGDGAAPTVTVVHQGTVGPYETVTLKTQTPGALNDWLATHGYSVDASTQPTIDAYVAEGFDFIALRLQPGKGTSAMTPVRVVQSGSSPALPLRMVGIGTGAEVPIVLFVIGEGRWATQNFPETRVESALLSWDFDTKQSNYDKLRKEALSANGGRSWLTAFAQQGTLTAPVFTNTNQYTGNGGQSFAQTYVDQAFSNQETKTSCTLPVVSQYDGLVENPCPAGEPPDSAKCGHVAAGHIDSRTFGCAGSDDVATALTGMHLHDVWVTRLEANLPHSALDTDLLLQAASKQEPVANNIQATIAIHPDTLCNPPAVNKGSLVLFPRLHEPGDPPSNGLGLGGFFGLTLGAMGLGLLARRTLGKRSFVMRG